MKTQSRSKRKPTGGLYKRNSKKHLHELARDFFPVKVAETKRKIVDARGCNIKVRLLKCDKAVLSNGKVSKILSVKENSANPHFVRMNVITKGAIIETEDGMAKVTSRPGQHGVVNAKLIK